MCDLFLLQEVKRDLKRIHGCRYNERLNTKTEGSKRDLHETVFIIRGKTRGKEYICLGSLSIRNKKGRRPRVKSVTLKL